jgi:hypothetical protein
MSLGLPSVIIEDECDQCLRCRGTGQMWLLPCFYTCNECDGSGQWTPDELPLDGEEDEFFGTGQPQHPEA